MNGEVEKICGYQPHPIAKLIPPMTQAEFERLTKSIDEHGLLEPITLHEGKILDGLHRGRACEKTGRSPRFVTWDGTAGSAVKWVMAKNRDRRHLSESQLGMLGADSEEIIQIEAKALERRMANLKNVEPKKEGGIESAPVRSREEERGKSVAKVAEIVGVSPRYVEMAKAVKKKNPELAQKVRDGEISLKKAEKQIRVAELTRKARVYLPPEGEYSVVAIDLPWKYRDSLDGNDSMRGGLPYPPMTLEEMIATVKIPAARDCVLFMWITNTHILEGWHVPLLKHWGFTAKYLITWHKLGAIGLGRTVRIQTEFLIIATKGSPVMNATTERTLQQGETIIDAPRGGEGHSRKPEEFYAFVDKLCPSLSRIEMFATVEDRPGWQTWGIEKGKHKAKAKKAADGKLGGDERTGHIAELRRECKVRNFNLRVDVSAGEAHAECNDCEQVLSFKLDAKSDVSAEALEEVREHTCSKSGAVATEFIGDCYECREPIESMEKGITIDALGKAHNACLNNLTPAQQKERRRKLGAAAPKARAPAKKPKPAAHPKKSKTKSKKKPAA